MATSNARRSIYGVVPWMNDLLAVGIVASVYLVRIGHVEEGVSAPIWLSLTTDTLLPLLAALWLLVVPAYRLWMMD